MKLDDLLNKKHVKENPIIRAYKKQHESMRSALLKHAQSDLTDLFSMKPGQREEDRHLPNLVREAVNETANLLAQFNLPRHPDLSVVKTSSVKYARNDDNRVVSGTVVLGCKLLSLSGVDMDATIPVSITPDGIIPPSVFYCDGREHVIAQSSFDSIIDRHTSYELPALREQYRPPFNRDEAVTAVEIRNATGWQPRKPFYPDEHTGLPMMHRRDQDGNFPNRTMQAAILQRTPTGYNAVVDVLEKAEADGIDVFPRAWVHLYDTYIRPTVGVANETEWSTFLINDGWCINPYSFSHRGQAGGRGQRKKSMKMRRFARRRYAQVDLSQEIREFRQGLSDAGLYYDESAARSEVRYNTDDNPDLFAMVQGFKAMMSHGDESNMEVVISDLTEGDPGHVRQVRGGEYLVQVFEPDGSLTRAGEILEEIMAALASYPVLDDEDLSRREYEETLENIDWEGRSLVSEDAPDDWAAKVFSWLWNNNQEALEGDDGVGYPSEEEISEALDALGWLESDEDDWDEDDEEPEPEPPVDPRQMKLPGVEGRAQRIVRGYFTRR